MVKVLSLLRSVVEVLMPILCICQFHSGFATLSDVSEVAVFVCYFENSVFCSLILWTSL
jgi:TRAP-type C4-dicarboxylate transport system permease large subunit